MLAFLKKNFDLKKCERVAFLLLADIVCINLAAFLTVVLRFEFDLKLLETTTYLQTLIQLALPHTLIVILLFACLRLYSSLWAYAGAAELERILIASGLLFILHTAVIWLGLVDLPRSYPFLYGLILCMLTIFTRFSYRFLRRSRIARRGQAQQRTLLIGAGQAGATVLREFTNSKYSRNRVVCIIDDNQFKQGQRLMGVKIVGGREDIEDAVHKYDVQEIVIAIPTLTPASKRELLNICQRTGCKLKQIPGLYQLANGDIRVQSIRDVEIEDLLEREVVRVDMGGIGGHIRNKVVLVTGGGGSIGSELCRQLAHYKPRKLILFDIYENNAYAIQQELLSRHPELDMTVLIGSVRDYARIDRVMADYAPALVYHAAAHKHVPLMEVSPLEAVKNNVFGTLNTARAAAKHHVEHFVLISSDKAVNPTNVMGATKRICEMIIQTMDEQSDTCFAAVRFGNVLGSNGSVIPLFREQIKAGGPVTVTHPEINRFFMTIPEAVSLVLQAGAFAHGGEIFVLDMGKPVKIDDLARNMIRLSGFEPDVDIPIVYTGLRPGEKLYEELLLNEEGLSRTANDLIYVGQKIHFDHARFMEGLEALHDLSEGQEDALRRQIRALVPTYSPTQVPAVSAH